MSSQPIVCAACDAPVPFGRLSCPACGELLASVAGAPRTQAARATTKRAPKRAGTTAVPPILTDVPPPAVAVAEARLAGTEAIGWDPAVPDAGAGVDPSDRDLLEWPVAGSEADPRSRAGSISAIGAAGAAGPPSAATNGSHLTGPQAAAAVPVPGGASAAASPAAPWATSAMAPGAYVPPPVVAIPAGPPAPARAWAGQTSTDGVTAEGGEPRATPSELLDAARLPEFIGWLAVAGAALAAVGFVLPWGISVIGARGVDYFDRWGLAGPYHPIVFVSLLGLLGLSLVRNPIPLWVRVGLPGLGLGALLIGLIWPYLVGLTGTGPGALVVTIGAAALVAAGLAALSTDRHAAEDRPV